MSNPLKLVKPMAVTAAMLTTNVLENDYAAWVSGTTYALGDRVIRTSVHKVYERLVAGAGATAPESDATNWLEVGPTNRWKMFDGSNSTQTSRAGNITVTIAPGQVVNSIALLNVVATSVRIQVIDPVDGTVYDKTTTMQAPLDLADWYAYFFGTIQAKTQVIATDLPNYGSASITVTITAATGNAACGVCLLGLSRSVGDFGVAYGCRIGITDYSRKEKNAFGDTSFIERAYSKRATLDMLIPRNQVDYVSSLLSSVRATPTLYIASDEFESLAIYGFYKDWGVTIAYHDYSQCSLDIEGLT